MEVPVVDEVFIVEVAIEEVYVPTEKVHVAKEVPVPTEQVPVEEVAPIPPPDDDDTLID